MTLMPHDSHVGEGNGSFLCLGGNLRASLRALSAGRSTIALSRTRAVGNTPTFSTSIVCKGGIGHTWQVGRRSSPPKACAEWRPGGDRKRLWDCRLDVLWDTSPGGTGAWWWGKLGCLMCGGRQMGGSAHLLLPQ